MDSYRLPITDYRLPITEYRIPNTEYRIPITDYRLPITDYRVGGSSGGSGTCTSIMPSSQKGHNIFLKPLHK
ncbi:MAG TPA: hypothetical protein EYG38_10140 [Verrucomicrobia bacterium]|nr:hypothetical protein [Verrucomicrobiota bacterium]